MQPDHSIGFRAKLTMLIESHQLTEMETAPGRVMC